MNDAKNISKENRFIKVVVFDYVRLRHMHQTFFRTRGVRSSVLSTSLS